MSLVDAIRDRLTGVLDPCSVAAGNSMNIVEMGLIDRIEVTDGRLHLYLRLTSPTCPMLEHFAKETHRVLQDVPDVDAVELHGDTGMDWTPDRLSPEAQQRRRVHLSALLASTARPLGRQDAEDR